MPQDPTQFRADLEAGQAVEQAVGEWAIERGWVAHRTCGCVAGYDLMLTCTLEVKCDRMAPRTGNVAIEVEFRGKPSGIAKTSAVFWCVVVGDVGHIIRVEKLRRLAERYPTVPAGDGKLARVHLVPLAELKAVAKEIHLPGISGASDVPSTAPGAEEAKALARRKEIYEALHPETKHGATLKKGTESPKRQNVASGFTADTAARTGKSNNGRSTPLRQQSLF